MIAFQKGATIYAQPKNRSPELVQGEAVDEYRRALLAPLSSAPYGSRTASPKLVALAKHVQQGENKVAETTVALAFGALQLGVGINDVCRPFRVIEGMLRAQVPTPCYSLPEMMEVETKMDASIDCLQARYLVSDKSDRTKRELLEQFEEYAKITGQIVDQLRKEIYSGPRR